MNRSFWIAVLGMLSCGCLFSQQKHSVPVTITISPQSQTIKSGSDVYVKVQLTNDSNEPVDCSSFYVGGSDRRFRIEVLGEGGESMRRADQHPEMMPGNLQPCTLQPGQSTSPKDDLISLFNDLSRPGIYKIRFSRVIDADEKNGTAWSNTITITIVK